MVSRRRSGRDVHHARLSARAVRDAGGRAQSEFDWAGYQSRDGAARHRIGRRPAGRAVPVQPVGRAQKDAARAREFLGYETTTSRGPGRGHHRPGRAVRADRRDRPRAADLPSCSTRRRSMAKAAGRSATPANLSADGFRFEVIDTQKEGGFTLHLGHLRAGQAAPGSHGHGPRRRRARAGRAFAGPTRPRTCCTTRCKSTWASTPSSRARKSIAIGCGSISPIPRPLPREELSQRSKPKSTS